MLQEYYSLQQVRMSVKEYEIELNRLRRFIPEALKTSEEAKVSRFVIRLKA